MGKMEQGSYECMIAFEIYSKIVQEKYSENTKLPDSEFEKILEYAQNAATIFSKAVN